MGSPNLKQHILPRRSPIVRQWVAALSLLMVGSANAQPARPENADDAPAGDETVALSPFLVDSTKDTGYRATSTLAGSRINTDLRDLASPITVVTKEFMEDIGAVDVNDILHYTANTEGAYDFTATTPTLGRPSDDASRSPQTANRVRGLFPAGITRDYFYSISDTVGFDSYNLNEVTLARGANSILAGLGKPGGIINYSPYEASLGRNFGEVTLRYGSYDDRRATASYNYVLKPKVLALRVATAISNKEYRQKPSYNRDRRYFGALTWKPFEKTDIRVKAEYVKVNAKTPNSLTPEDDVTPWLEGGRPTYDSTSTDPIDSRLFQDGDVRTVFYNASGKPEKAYNTNAFYVLNQQQPSDVSLWSPLRLHDSKYVDLEHVNYMPSFFNQKYKSLNVSVTQELVSKMFLNLSFLREKIDASSLDLFRPEYSNLLVDVNKFLPTGETNPHYGEIYMQFRGLDNRQNDEKNNTVGRATLTYDLDFRKTSKWFGHHVLTGFAEKRRSQFDHAQYNAKDAKPNISESGNTTYPEMGYRYYLGTLAGSGKVSSVSPGTPGDVSGVDLINGSDSRVLDSFYWLKSQSRKTERIMSTAGILQSYLLDDQIIGLAGIRRDRPEQKFDSAVDPDNVDPKTGMLLPMKEGKWAVGSKTTPTYGVVIRPKILKWVSLHWNRSETWQPSPGLITLEGDPTPAPAAVSKDIGFTLSTPDDSLSIKFNWFKVVSANGDAGNPANFPLAQWNMTFLDLTVMPDIAKQAGVAYTPGVAAGITVGDPRIAYTSDNVSKGLEVEMVYNVTKNWRIMANVAKQESSQSNIAPSLSGFIESRIDYYKSLGLWNSFRTNNNPWGLQQTGEEHFNQFLLGNYLFYRAVDGQPATQLAKWHANLVTNYSFTEGFLKNFNIGGSVRYIDKQVIGNPVIKDASGNVTGLDLEHPFTNGARYGVDAWIGYKIHLKKRNELSFQLNIRDLTENGGYRPITANSDGTIAAYRIITPRSFFLTTRYEF